MPPLHLAIALDDAGWHPAAALESEARHHNRLGAAWWQQVVGEADRAPIALVTIADRHHFDEPSSIISPGRLDALLIAARVAPVTRRVGLVASVTTSLTEPFLASSQLATLDFVSGGRGGWEVDISTRRGDGGYVGPRAVPPVDERAAEAAEFVEVVRALWDSWEDGAEIRDRATHRFVDRQRLHRIEYAGRYLSVAGPSITPRPPQGQPLVAVRAHDDAGVGFAAAHADLAFVAAPSPEEMSRRVAAVAERATGDRPLCFAEMVVVLDASEATARRRRDQLDERAGGPPAWAGLSFTGTPRGLARWLTELAESCGPGLDGVRLHPAAIPEDLYAITRELTDHLPVPTAVGADGPATTLRARLALARPANRYAESR